MGVDDMLAVVGSKTPLKKLYEYLYGREVICQGG
jgi:hypothetical protein